MDKDKTLLGGHVENWIHDLVLEACKQIGISKSDYVRFAVREKLKADGQWPEERK